MLRFFAKFLWELAELAYEWMFAYQVRTGQVLCVTFGTGIMPSGQTAAELSAVTRRAFVPKLVVQLYNTSPLMAAALANAQPATGGFSSVTVPLQGTPFVNFGWSDYTGSFQMPSGQTGVQNGEYNLKWGIIPIPFLGAEGLVQVSHAVIPLVEARMNDATNVAMDAMATAAFNNYSNNQQFLGLPASIDDGTNLVSYAGINRNTNTWFKSKVYNVGSGLPTRVLVNQYIAGTVKSGGEMPSFGIMGLGTWAALAQDYISNETYVITPESSFDREPAGPRSAFRALMVAGMPVYADPYCPEGILYLVNSNYIALYLHEAAPFAFTGFQSTLANAQIGYIGAVVIAAELVNVKPKTMTRVFNFTPLNI